jgi:hypothetical protein
MAAEEEALEIMDSLENVRDLRSPETAEARRLTNPRTARSGRMIAIVGSISYVGSQTRVVLDESPDPALCCRGTGDRHDVGTHHLRHGVAGKARRRLP